MRDIPGGADRGRRRPGGLVIALGEGTQQSDAFGVAEVQAQTPGPGPGVHRGTQFAGTLNFTFGSGQQSFEREELILEHFVAVLAGQSQTTLRGTFGVTPLATIDLVKQPQLLHRHRVGQGSIGAFAGRVVVHRDAKRLQ